MVYNTIRERSTSSAGQWVAGRLMLAALALVATTLATGDVVLQANELQPEVAWQTDYASAVHSAQRQGKYLLVVFYRDPLRDLRQIQLAVLADPLRQFLDRYVPCQTSTESRIVIQGQQQRLLDHPAFEELAGGPGLAVIDYANPGQPQYGDVVSILPFTPGKYYRYQPQHLRVLLDLPPGTLTQRTMIFAVRIHPERPASTDGEHDRSLAVEAESHSEYQARIRVQGHHNWGWRFHRIVARLGGGLRATEVVAESWPGERLVDAAVDCVYSWRQSPGHWSAVRGRHVRYAYDIRRGSNGIWYATGIFGHRR
jgi:hypothetical protein